MLSYKVDLFVQLGLIRQSTGFVLFNASLIFFIVKAEEELQDQLSGCHDRGYYECSEKYPVFCGKVLYYIRTKSAASRTTVVSFPPIAAPSEMSSAYIP